MDAEPPLDYLLDGPTGPTPGRDELLAIVARSRARRFRVVAMGMAVTLVVGVGAGWLVGSGSGKSSGGATLAAGGSPTTEIIPHGGFPVTGGAAAGAAVAPAPETLVKEFVRTTSDGVTLRAYEEPDSGGVVSLTPCGGNGSSTAETLPPTLDVEVSTALVADQVYSGYGPSETPFPSISVSTIGVAEGAPVWVVTVRVTASVALVKVTFSDGKTDQMAPVADWAVLAHVVPKGTLGTTTSYGTAQAYDPAGKLIAGVTFPIEPVVTGSPTTIVVSPPGVPETTLPGTAVGGTTLPGTVPGVQFDLPAQSTPTTTVIGASPPQTLSPAIVPPTPCITALPPGTPPTTVPGGH